jgi:phosphoglycerate-specific signal transduction histidine kinase
VDASKNPYPPLLSLAVHEFRTPASVVGGYLRMLQKDQDPPMSERQRRMIDEAEKSCARLVAIVAELSDIGKLDGGSIKLNSQPLELFSLTENVAELVHEGQERDVKLQLLGPSDGAPMTGDVTRLKTAFDAVFRAILREKPGPATVVAERRLATRDGKPAAIVIIADEGSVQEAYDREPGPFDDRRGGLGLALPLARRVFEGHGASIWSPAAVASTDEESNRDPLARGSVIISFPLGS